MKCPREIAVKEKMILDHNVVMNCIKEHRKEGTISEGSEGCSGCPDYPSKWETKQRHSEGW